jgi:hypothetical protein
MANVVLRLAAFATVAKRILTKSIHGGIRAR